MTTLLATIVVLGVLIFVHELGHFMAAKAVDIEVQRFSIGLGPKMFGFTRGETEYVISWLPLGGYVKMAGMADEDATSALEGGSDAEPGRQPGTRDFESKSVLARAFVLLAGVGMNWLFAFLAFVALALGTGIIEPRVEEVGEDSPAEVAGLEVGDLVLSINGQRTRNSSQLIQEIQKKPGEQIHLVIDRAGEELAVVAVPDSVMMFSEIANDSLLIGRVGVRLGSAASHRTLGIGEALLEGGSQTSYYTMDVLRFLKNLVTGRNSARDLGGPILIGQLSGAAMRAGVWALLFFMAIISINLAVLNLLPIPVLDGGHLLFLMIEAVRGKAVSIDQRLRWTTVGMVLVVGLMIWAVGNDLLRLFGL